MAVAGALLPGESFAAVGAANSGLVPNEVVSLEIVTDTTFALQPSGADNYISPLLAETGLSAAPIFDSELHVRFAVSANEDSGDAGWDYLWNAASKIPINAVPEPSTTTLILTGAFLLGRRFRKKLS